MTVHTGRHFLQIPGPSTVPDRVLRAMDMPTIDHRGPEFAKLGNEVIEGCQTVFKTKGPVIIYPSSGTGAWEAALVNTLSPGDKVLMFETGHFATLWRNLAENGASRSSSFRAIGATVSILRRSKSTLRPTATITLRPLQLYTTRPRQV